MLPVAYYEHPLRVKKKKEILLTLLTFKTVNSKNIAVTLIPLGMTLPNLQLLKTLSNIIIFF